jgi:cytochrome c
LFQLQTSSRFLLSEFTLLSMIRFKYKGIIFSLLICFLAACGQKAPESIYRPTDPWAFRSVLDRQPRMLTLALDSALYVAYDLSRCTLYKAWKGGVTMEGTVYTAKKNVQPTSWGTAYASDSLQQLAWLATLAGKQIPAEIVNQGYVFKKGQIYLKHALVLSAGDTIQIEERPEFIQSASGKPGLERLFQTAAVPEGVTVSLKFADSSFPLRSNATTRLTTYFSSLPTQHPPQPLAEIDHMGRYWMEKSDCFTCHEMDQTTVGPSFRQVAQRYGPQKDAEGWLVQKIKNGGSGVWGQNSMNPHPALSESEIRTMLKYIFTLTPEEDVKVKVVSAKKEAPIENNFKPGFGAPLEGVHPSYDLSTIRPPDFKPRVGGLAFMPDGRLLVTTWDAEGAVYLLEGVETGDAGKVKVKRIASGLAEPLGIEVVDGEIYVLQKHELTKLTDLDGDGIIDAYQAVCNSWGVTDDFHEFAFGLVHKDGYFYATLSMAMRLMEGEKQKPERGRTLKISRDGRFETLNYGLRTPNGIGQGVDGELFVADNQGQWLPANKLIHVREGDYHGMAWGILDATAAPPVMTSPAIWLPQNEIGNSPSEPVLMRDGPYKGQMLHGDVSHGGIKRDFLEKINGAYQGAVFRFSQGLEAGVNRLCWGPDGALYAGGVGMVGGWSWKENQYGLQRLKYNGKTTFEMLAIRAKPKGFEIEFTEAIKPGQEIQTAELLVQQWWYQPTPRYGGPKMDLEDLRITQVEMSADRKRVYLEIPGLKKEHVVYFRLPEKLQSSSGQSLWSSEAWYTLNNIPE